MTRDTRRRLLSHVVIVLCGLAVLIALVPLALVLFHVVGQGISSVNAAFFTEMPRPVGETGGGMANAIVGSLIVTLVGALFALPIGIMSGVYTAEYPGRGWRQRRGSRPTRSTVCRRLSSACSSTASPCCHTAASRRWPADWRSAS